MTRIGTAVVVLAAMSLVSVEAARAGDATWYQPLETKARILEEQVRGWHWIDGLYPSQVEVPPDGGTPDHSTNGVSNVMHTVCWTANHLAGESYRYALVKKTGTPDQIKAVRDHVNAIFEAVHRCQKITGVPGLQARGYLYGHGPTYEERINDPHADYWYQGAGEYKDLRWRGAPSHHNYSDAIHGLGVYYRMAAEGKHKDQCRQAIFDLVSKWADNDLKIPTEDERSSRHGFSMLLMTDGKTPTMPVIMVAAGLKVAHFATGKEKFAKLYEKIVTQFGFRKRTTFRRFSRLDADDAEHVFCHLDNLLNMEKDAKLRTFYRAVLEGLWESHKDSKCPLYNYIYIGLTPDAKDKDKYLGDALWTLRSHPTDTFFQPRMNSLRTDIKKDGRYSKEPMAVFEAAWDNEYMWKGHLYQLDGWTSRNVKALDVTHDDPMVIYAVDQIDDVYLSGDGAKTWRWIGKSPAGRVTKIVCGRKRRHVFLTTPRTAFRSTTGGASWSRLALPAGCGTITDLQVDKKNANRLYLVTDRGVYLSLDFGEKWVGERWRCLTPIVPPAGSVRLTLAQGKPGMVYGWFDGELRGMALAGGKWSEPTRLGLDEYLKTYPWLLVDPDDPKRVTCGYRLDFRNIDADFIKASIVGSLLSRSTDGGASWTYSRQSLMKRLDEQGAKRVILEVMRDLVPHFLDRIAIDPRDPNVIYGGGGTKFVVSGNRGRSWTKVLDGLDIPRVDSLFVPRTGDYIYAGTPAGLYRLKRGAGKWQYANLRLQFDKNTRRDLGGAAYLDAYWRGRYFGFIGDKQATETPTKWSIPERYRAWVPGK